MHRGRNGAAEREGCLGRRPKLGRERCRERRTAVGAAKLEDDAHPARALSRPVRERHVRLQRSRAQRGIQLRPEPEVPEVHRGHGVQEDVALEPADLPIVLVLQVIAVREAVDLDGHRVLAGAEMIRDVELRGRLAPS
jgi:hypothetical protein